MGRKTKLTVLHYLGLSPPAGSSEFPAMPASPVPDLPLSRPAASNIWEMSQPSQAKHMGLKARN